VKDATHCHVSSAKITVTITSFKCSRRGAFSAHFVLVYYVLWEVQGFEIPMHNCEFVPQSISFPDLLALISLSQTHSNIPFLLAKESLSREGRSQRGVKPVRQSFGVLGNIL